MIYGYGPRYYAPSQVVLRAETTTSLYPHPQALHFGLAHRTTQAPRALSHL
jgi:hypothetical protein